MNIGYPSFARAIALDRTAFERSRATVETLVARIAISDDRVRFGLALIRLTQARYGTADIWIKVFW